MLPETVQYERSALDRIADADLLSLLPNGANFGRYPRRTINGMRGTTMIDLRNLYQPDQMIAAGTIFFNWPITRDTDVKM